MYYLPYYLFEMILPQKFEVLYISKTVSCGFCCTTPPAPGDPLAMLRCVIFSAPYRI